MNEHHSILVVDDELANLQKLKRTFLGDFEVYEASSGDAALQFLRKQSVAVIITDQRMPGMSGVDMLRKSLEVSPDSVRIILTGYTEVEDLMDAINEGHVHRYITKPWEPFSLRETVRRELESWKLRKENDRLNRELKVANKKLAQENYSLRQEVEVLRENTEEFRYGSDAMKRLLKLVDRVVQSETTVLIQGETGTGKELLARYIHRNSARVSGPFIPVNCGAVPADLVESAFFGHRKGSFTGATEDKKGYFELADGGTLFLDEVGESPLDLQVKLLRVLQEAEIFPVGAERPSKVDVRVVASTNRNLQQRVQEDRFRQDLFFRLNVFSVYMPPLRARKEDIPVLAEFFLERFRQRENKRLQGFDPATLDLFLRYEWPGNVRELQNEVERLVILSDAGASIAPETVSDHVRMRSSREGNHSKRLKDQVADLEKRLILSALQAHHNNKSQAASVLGITRQTIISKLKQYQKM